MAAAFSSEDAKEEFEIDIIKKEFLPRYNLAPSQDTPVIISGSKVFDLFKWGFIPHWAKDKNVGYKMINTRAETITEKPSFKKAFQDFRCVILASGFYEWKDKIPYYFKLKGIKIFALAGIASLWKNESGIEIGTCSIITVKSNSLIKKFHDRMPVILDKEKIDIWIKKDNKDINLLQSFLIPFNPKKMEYYQVSNRVNSVKNESSDLLDKI